MGVKLGVVEELYIHEDLGPVWSYFLKLVFKLKNKKQFLKISLRKYDQMGQFFPFIFKIQ